MNNKYSHGAGNNLLRRIKDFNPRKHVFKEGSRRHVVYYNDKGKVCSEPECEINTSPVQD